MTHDTAMQDAQAAENTAELDFKLGAEKISLSTQAPLLQLVDVLLKAHHSLYQYIRLGQNLTTNTRTMALLALLCLLVYGVIMGAFSGGIQWWVAPLKLALGTALAALLCYPSLYILAALSGADLRPSQAAMLLVSSLALTALLLIGFAPVAFVFTFSIQALSFMGLVHLLVWFTSLYFGLRFAARGVAELGGKDPTLLKVWALIFLLTLMQMSTTLRPVLGAGERLFTPEKQFFLEHWLTTFAQEQRR